MHAFQTVVGLDVHKNSIAVAVLKPGDTLRMEHWTIANEPPEITKLVQGLAAKGSPSFCYEVGPCGYPVHRQITQMGWPCAVIAPGMTPIRPGDRVKTDRRDADQPGLGASSVRRLWLRGGGPMGSAKLGSELKMHHRIVRMEI